MSEYDYSCTVVRIIDADTVILTVDLGFRLSATMPFRLYGVDAPELPTPAGVAARDFAVAWLADTQSWAPLRVTTYKADSFGRWLAEVYAATGEPPEPHLTGALVAAGHAVFRLYR